MSVATAAVAFSVGLALLALGYLLRYRHATRLVAEYGPDEVEDGTALAEFVGANVLWIGVLTVDVAVVELNFRSKSFFWLAYAALVALLTARTLYGARKRA